MIFLCFADNSIQLVPDGTLFLHIAIILIMVFVLNATLFKPINRILEDREKSTRGRSGEAQSILRRVEEALTRYERTLREARAEGYRRVEEERAIALGKRQIRLTTIREEVSRTIEEQTRDLATQAEAARVTLEVDARRLAADIGAHILRRPVSETTISSVS